MFQWFTDIFVGCYEIMTYKFTFGGITFDLLDVAIVSVLLGVFSIFIWAVLLDESWGD